MKYRFALLLMAILSSHWADAAPKPDLWEHWQPAPGIQSAAMDFSDWQRFLDLYVHVGGGGIHRVAYGDVNDEWKARLATLRNSLADVDPRSLSGDEQQAFWINSYNLLVVELVLQHYPVDSIKDIRLSFKSVFNGGPWADKLATVGGKRVSLNDIEHRILRPIWKDRRFHFALNCASVGCPNLAKKVYRAQSLEQQLAAAETEFLNAPRAFKLVGGEADSKSKADREIEVSSLFKWYWQDFASEPDALAEYFNRQGLKAAAGSQFHFHYDWALNELTPQTDSADK